jgi:Ubiquitin family
MQIFIKTLTGRKQQLNFENESTVLEVKQALQEKEGIQVDQIRLCTYPQNAICHHIHNTFVLRVVQQAYL